MVWQDIVLAIFNIIASYALVPQVYHGFKNKKGSITFQTAILSTISLVVFTIVYATLGLVFSTISCVACTILWALLLFQRIKYEQPKILKANKI